MKKTVIFATDHAGFELKNKLMPFVLNNMGYEIVDMGAHDYNEEDDYPDYITPACSRIVSDLDNTIGIILGGSGTGEAIAANRFRGIRAVVCNSPNMDVVRLAREHNNVNVLSLGARFLSEEQSMEAVRIFLETKFSDEERHARRIGKIDS